MRSSLRTRAVLTTRLLTRRLVTVLQIKDEREIVITFWDWIKFFVQPHAVNEMMVVTVNVEATPLMHDVSPPDAARRLDWCAALLPELGVSTLDENTTPNALLIGYHGGGANASRTMRLEKSSTHASGRMLPPVPCRLLRRASLTQPRLDALARRRASSRPSGPRPDLDAASGHRPS